MNNTLPNDGLIFTSFLYSVILIATFFLSLYLLIIVIKELFDDKKKTSSSSRLALVPSKKNSLLILPNQILPTLESLVRNLPSKDSLGAVNRGILLHGAPGTGKTTFAELLASELEWPFYKLDIMSLKSKYFGEYAKNFKKIMDQLCEQALKDKTPIVVLIDEADSLLAGRETNSWGQANMDTVNCFLANYCENSSWRRYLLVILCTNFPDRIDTAVTRLGRIGTHIHFSYSAETLMEIFKKTLSQENISSRLTPGETIELIEFFIRDPELATPTSVLAFAQYIKKVTNQLPPTSFEELMLSYHQKECIPLKESATPQQHILTLEIMRTFIDNHTQKKSSINKKRVGPLMFSPELQDLVVNLLQPRFNTL